jgi:drug/metabolite transporter (DMT)-like permease
LGIGTNIDLLENRVCSGHFHFYLFVKFTLKELKPTTVAVFIYLQPVFATVFAIGLGKDELNLVKYCRQF